jgi:replicative DNA helicase
MTAPDHIASSRALWSVESEQAVLGGLLLDNNAFDRIAGLEPAHFYRLDHRQIYSRILGLIVAGKPADVVTVFDALQERGVAADVGGLTYLTELAHSTPSAANIARYAQTVRDRALLRETLATVRRVQELVQTPSAMNGAEILDCAQSMLARLAQAGVRKEPRLLRDLLPAFAQTVDERIAGTGQTAIPTGLPCLDKALNGGVRRGNLVVVAGRPSMGKTALTTNIGLNMASDYSVLLLSMEMADQEIVARAVASRGEVALSTLLGRLDQHDDGALIGMQSVFAALETLRFAVDDTPALTLLDVRMKARTHQRKYGLDVLIVDYLGLMTGGEEKQRTQQIGAYSRGLKALAKDLNAAVIVLSQLSRKSEERPDKKPQLADLRDSGDIEQDADVVLLVHRPEMYQPADLASKGYAEVMIRKQRNGALGDVPLLYRGAVTRFDEWAGPLPSLSAGAAARRRDVVADL